MAAQLLYHDVYMYMYTMYMYMFNVRCVHEHNVRVHVHNLHVHVHCVHVRVLHYMYMSILHGFLWLYNQILECFVLEAFFWYEKHNKEC